MNQPNDIVFAPNGNMYASDPDWPNQKGQLLFITQTFNWADSLTYKRLPSSLTAMPLVVPIFVSNKETFFAGRIYRE